jgi:hypothetical protein
MTTATTTISESELGQVNAIALATARLLGADFTPECSQQVSFQIASTYDAPVPPNDAIAVAAGEAGRRKLLEARVAMLVAFMVASETSAIGPDTSIILLDENVLSQVLLAQLCFWPFWTGGC